MSAVCRELYAYILLGYTARACLPVWYWARNQKGYYYMMDCAESFLKQYAVKL
jgi:hypothetical protein